MSNPASVDTARANSVSNEVWLGPDFDDEDEAVYDDSDEDDPPSASSSERWLSRPGFGSPQWWSRT